jgi:hypothetical protein
MTVATNSFDLIMSSQLGRRNDHIDLLIFMPLPSLVKKVTLYFVK